MQVLGVWRWVQCPDVLSANQTGGEAEYFTEQPRDGNPQVCVLVCEISTPHIERLSWHGDRQVGSPLEVFRKQMHLVGGTGNEWSGTVPQPL